MRGKTVIKRIYNTIRREGLDRTFILGIRYLSWRVRFQRLVSFLPSRIAGVIFIITQTSVQLLIRILSQWYPNKYTDADPYKLIRADPAEIVRISGESEAKRRGWVDAGEWDKSEMLFMERTIPKSIHQRYIEEIPWSETILANKSDDDELLREEIEKIERLVDNIKREGYQSQRELVSRSDENTWSLVNDSMHPVTNEVAVNIGRDGELLWCVCGQHRLAVAKVLGVEEIPVQVFRRHVRWQSIRHQCLREGQIPSEFRNHPDLDELLDSETTLNTEGNPHKESS